MGRLTLSARGPLSAEEALERYLQPALWPTWAPQMRRVDYHHERLRPATSGRVVPLLGPAVPFDVLAVDEAHGMWTWRVRLLVVDLKMTHHVEPDPVGSLTTLEMEGPLPVLLGYAPVARYALHRLVRP